MEVKPPREHRCLDAGKLSPGQGGKAGDPFKQPWLVVPMARASQEGPSEEAAWAWAHSQVLDPSVWCLCGTPRSAGEGSEIVRPSRLHCPLTE